LFGLALRAVLASLFLLGGVANEDVAVLPVTLIGLPGSVTPSSGSTNPDSSMKLI